MTATQLKEKYPDFWDTIYNDTKVDLLMWEERREIEFGVERKVTIENIAHNAAFNATFAHDKALK